MFRVRVCGWVGGCCRLGLYANPFPNMVYYVTGGESRRRVDVDWAGRARHRPPKHMAQLKTLRSKRAIELHKQFTL